MVACDLSGFCSARAGRMPTRYVWNKLRTSRMRHWMSFWCPGGTSFAHAYPIATRHLGKARARLHRLLNDVAFVRLAEPPPTAIACRRNDERLLRRAVSHMAKAMTKSVTTVRVIQSMPCKKPRAQGRCHCHVGNSTSHRLFKTNSHESSCRPGADHTFGMHRERQTLPLS